MDATHQGSYRCPYRTHSNCKANSSPYINITKGEVVVGKQVLPNLYVCLIYMFKIQSLDRDKRVITLSINTQFSVTRCEYGITWLSNCCLLSSQWSCYSPTSLSVLQMEGCFGNLMGQRWSGATASPSPAPFSHSILEASSIWTSLGLTGLKLSQQSTTLPPFTFLLRSIQTRGTTVVFMKLKSPTCHSILSRQSCWQSAFEVKYILVSCFQVHYHEGHI